MAERDDDADGATGPRRRGAPKRVPHHFSSVSCLDGIETDAPGAWFIAFPNRI